MICVPIVAKTNSAALGDIVEANKVADFIELRLDLISKPDVEGLIKQAKKPVIVTVRKKSEGGKFSGTESSRISLLKKALVFNPDYIDLEFSIPKKSLNSLIKTAGKKTRVILSHHNMKSTPPIKDLNSLLAKMKKVKGAEIFKIVTTANFMDDSMSILEFLRQAKKKKTNIISFAMGIYGKDSRILSVPFGSYLTFGSLERGKESAEGQLTVDELNKIYKGLSVML
ncbi:MAG: type I 3-dehydroquinate dehydratase [Candidatus Diapherotrites archaeon]